MSCQKIEDLPLVLTVPEIAGILRINRTAAYQLTSSKTFPSIKIGKRIIIPRDAFYRWLEVEVEKKSCSG